MGFLMFNVPMTDDWGWGPNTISAIGASFAVVGVLVALVVAIATLRDTRKVVKNSERPWIGANKSPRLNVPVAEQDPSHSNTPDYLYITFSNWGKLPGQNIKYTATIGKTEGNQSDEWDVGDDGALFPGEPGTQGISLRNHGEFSQWQLDQSRGTLRFIISYSHSGTTYRTVLAVRMWYHHPQPNEVVSWSHESAT